MYNYKAKVIRWIDGDTVLLEIDLGFEVTKVERLRLARINAPEINSTVPFQVRKAKHAKSVAKRFCPNGSEVLVSTKKGDRDMYARYIGEIVFKGMNVSDFLIDNGCVKRVKF